MKRTLSALAGFALVALASTAEAQNPVHFGIAAGGTIGAGDLNDASQTGYNVTGTMAIMPPLMPLGFRAEVSFNRLSPEDGQPTTRDLDVVSATGNAVLSLPGPASAYLIGGVGYYNSHNLPIANVDRRSEDFGLNGGVGIRFGLTGFQTFAEVRYHRLFVRDNATDDNRNVALVPITFGIMF